ncbi:MAG: LLM class flavin-dependent oxidoreductase [Chloroflexota bacterium]|nr:LLM class flavin-dependent oxidoreductase [Chloroflexota bacterium]MDP9320818.1 LLM class flavin-dependent oxidoreductase [Chloroflexota bacterium]
MRFTFSNLPAVGWKLPMRDIVTVAQRCEDVGFDRFAIADLQFHFDCIAVMTAVATGTRRIGIESLVTNPFTRDASLIACAWAAVADVSGGRAIFGIGGGVEIPKRVWIAPFGHDRPHALDAVRECIDVVRAMWRGERVTFDGKVVHVHDVALDCPLPPPIPVLIAARGPRMLALAGEIADIVHLASLFLGRDNRAEELRRVAEGAQKAGRAAGSYEIDISVTVSASHDRERARRAALRNAAQSILWYAGADQYGRQREWSVPRGFAVPATTVEALARGWDMWKDPDLPADLGALITDDVLDQFTVWGEPLDCARRLGVLAADAPGATGFRVKLPLPLRSRTLSDYTGDVEALGEVIAAYRRASEPVAAGAR